MENNIEKKKNGVMVLVIILIIIILGLVGFIVYKELSSGTNNNNNNSNNGNNNTDNNQEDNKQNDNNAVDASDYKYTMDVYKTDDNMLCNNDKRDDICKTKAFTIKTESNGANVLTTNEKNIVLYNDNGLKIYNDKTKKIIKVDLDSNYDTYNLNVYNGEVIGVVYKNNDENSSYYDLTTKKSKFAKTYQNLGILDKNGQIKVNNKMETKIPGIYACGDIIKKDVYQIVTAESEGAIAATFAKKYIDTNSQRILKKLTLC